MKQIKLTAVFLAVAILLTGCYFTDEKAGAEKALGISLEQAKELSHSDDHGGFHGDGTLSISWEFPDNSQEEILKTAPHWKPLPLTEELEQVFYLRVSGGPKLYGENGEQLLPEIENGWYFFYDRHSESKDPYDGSETAGRFSYNFTAALYDADTNRLYYTEFDT